MVGARARAGARIRARVRVRVRVRVGVKDYPFFRCECFGCALLPRILATLPKTFLFTSLVA